MNIKETVENAARIAEVVKDKSIAASVRIPALGTAALVEDINNVHNMALDTVETVEVAASALHEVLKTLRSVRMALQNECDAIVSAIKAVDNRLCGENGRRFTEEGRAALDMMANLCRLSEDPKFRRILKILGEEEKNVPRK